MNLKEKGWVPCLVCDNKHHKCFCECDVREAIKKLDNCLPNDDCHVQADYVRMCIRNIFGVWKE